MALIVVAAIVLINVAASALESIVGGEPGGPVSSSFSTGGSGLEGYADLLDAHGHRVTRLRDAVGRDDLPAGSTVVVADPDQLTEAEVRALGEFVVDGGTLVVAGAATEPIVGLLTGQRVRWQQRATTDELDVWVPDARTGGAERLAGDRGGRWRDIGPLVPLVGADGQAAVVTAPVGDGTIVALADADLLHNQHLASADNAAFALALGGDAPRPVVFVESVHGFARGGLDAVPPSWKWATAGLALALLVGLWAAGARFGPPEPDHRSLRPPRLEHVRALAADLEAVSPPLPDVDGALRAGSEAARAERRRRGLPDDVGPATVAVDRQTEGSLP